MFKRIVIALIMVVLMGGVAIADKYTSEPRDYVFGGSTASGSFYAMSAPLASLWERDLDYVKTFSVPATTGYYENTAGVSMGTLDVAIGGLSCADAGQKGEYPYDGLVLTNLTAICLTGDAPCCYVVKKNSDIQTMSDIKGHSVATGVAGSGTAIEDEIIRDALGIGNNVCSRVDYIGAGQALEALTDGKVDVAVLHANYPNASLVQACLNNALRIVPFTDEEVAIVKNKLPWIVEDVVPGGTYNGMDEDIRIVAKPCVLIVNEQIPADVVYAMTKDLYENLDKLCEINTGYKQWVFDASKIENILPLHEGARRYYVEQGWISE